MKFQSALLILSIISFGLVACTSTSSSANELATPTPIQPIETSPEDIDAPDAAVLEDIVIITEDNNADTAELGTTSDIDVPDLPN